ncbi:hypothetical protein RUM43_000696 [Polyplax serrata]|uniref:Beta-galactosidase n=1 Tax=Polyplax serrata TaxID=468196 RepID=A0AAN8SDQ4_POLSC
MDGKPFQYVAGSVHYFRMPNEYWRDRLRKVKAAGLNAVSTYVEWSQHEQVPGEYNFEGDLDIKRFIEIAQEEGLYVILRPGPYICAERDMGGLPYWLMTKYPNIKLRVKDADYERHVEKWMDLLLEKLSHLLYGRGGPIILVQVENEYGSYSCDYNHTIWLRDLFKKHVKDDAVLFTTDGASYDLLKCGKIPDVYATVDFGPKSNVTKMFEEQRRFEPKGPLVNSEYYPGWLTHWGDSSLARRHTKDVIKTLKEMLDMKANINFYMFYGGSNFGFTAGANKFAKTYEADITSYDYDAPISEAGDLTSKYKAVKEVLQQYFASQSTINVGTAQKGNYGELTLQRVGTIFSPKLRQKLGKFHKHEQPLSFEALDQNFGYVLYETTASFNHTHSKAEDTLEIKKLSDLAHVYVDGKFVGNMSREHHTNKLKIKANGEKLSVMVENLGRINFGSAINDKKGILSPVLWKNEKLSDWNMTGFELKDLTAVEECFETREEICENHEGFVFYVKKFKLLPSNGTEEHYMLDSFLDVSHLTKGLIFINGFNLGRYWSWRGPQYSLYVPGVYLKAAPQDNVIIVLEENIKSDTISIKFTTTPIFS